MFLIGCHSSAYLVIYPKRYLYSSIIISTKLMAGKLNRSPFLQMLSSLAVVYEFGKQHKIKSFRTAESD